MDVLEREIQELSFDIRRKQIQLKELKDKRDSINRPTKLAEMIHRFEVMSPGAVKDTLQRLVRKGETFDEWYERWGKRTRGGRVRDSSWTRKHYEDCKKPTNNYASWLIETDDPRIMDTEAYAQSGGSNDGETDQEDADS